MSPAAKRLAQQVQPDQTAGSVSSLDAGDSEFVVDVDDVSLTSRPVGPPRRLGEMLVEQSQITREQVMQTLALQMQRGGRFGDLLVSQGFATAEQVLQALARQFDYPYSGGVDGRRCDELFVANQPFSEEVESFRELRSHLLTTVMAREQRHAVAVVSSDVGDGKTFLIANLAAAFSQLHGRTLVIDCDMRSPRLHQLFGLHGQAGLSSLLSGRSSANVIRPVLDLPNLYMLPVGVVPPNPLELILGAPFRQLFAELKTKFDYVLVDTPAAAHGSDARLIAVAAGAALVVGRRHRTRTKFAQRLVAQLNKASVQVAGVVMNEA